MTGGPGRGSRRSCLSVPGDSQAKLAKAFGLPADELVIDLEDAVAVEVKADARGGVVEALADVGGGGPGLAVRVNAAGTPWSHLDLIAVAGLPDAVGSVVVPKVESAGDVAYVERLLDGAEAGGGRTRPLLIQALIETARGVSELAPVAASGPRLEALILGYADLGASLGMPRGSTARTDLWLGMQSDLLLAARANGLEAIDGPYLGVETNDDFLTSARRARDLGFDGKWAIHPRQLEALNEIFTPQDEEVAWARRVIESLERSERDDGEGVTVVDGQMIDQALRLGAERVLARVAPR